MKRFTDSWCWDQHSNRRVDIVVFGRRRGRNLILDPTIRGETNDNRQDILVYLISTPLHNSMGSHQFVIWDRGMASSLLVSFERFSIRRTAWDISLSPAGHIIYNTFALVFHVHFFSFNYIFIELSIYLFTH